MEYWEPTLKRSQATLSLWSLHIPTFKVGAQSATNLGMLIQAFESLAQSRITAEFTYDEAYRAVQRALDTMKVLGTKVPVLIQAHLEENGALMKEVQLLFQTTPRTEATILKRARELYPVWVRANAAMAALIPPQPEILRVVGGVAYSAAMLKGLLDEYADLIKAMEDKAALVEEAKEAQRENDRTADRLNKRFYQMAKASHDAGSAVHEALREIPTEPSTPPPKPIEIATVRQGGESGTEVVVSLEPGGGAHATRREVQWMVEGVDEDFAHSAEVAKPDKAKAWPPLVLGPFAPGQSVKIRTLAGNSAAQRTGAPRTLRIGDAVT